MRSRDLAIGRCRRRRHDRRKRARVFRARTARQWPRRPHGARPSDVMTATYYDVPLLKAPVWTWEVPVYFFAGGAAGGAAVIGAVAEWTGTGATLARDARWIAAAGGPISAALLTADLGRPERFLNMLRVLKPQSAMSVGSWTLTAFSATSTAALIRPFTTIAAPSSALLGAGMLTYTG